MQLAEQHQPRLLRGKDRNPMEHNKKHRSIALFAASLGFTVVLLDVTVVNIALESIRSELGSSLSGLEWVVNTYTLTFAAFLLSAGAIGDIWGAKRVFLIGFAVFTFASIACGYSSSIIELNTARLLQGCGAAILVPNSLALVSQMYSDPQERTKAISVWASVGGLALAAGPLVGGGLLSQFGWRSIFLLNVPLGVGAMWATYRYAPSGARQSDKKIDKIGQFFAVAGLACLTTAVIEVGDRQAPALVVEGCAVASVVAFVALIISQKLIKQPMLPLELFKVRAFTTSSLIGVLVNFSFYGLIFLYSLFFQRVWRYSPLQTGFAFMPMTAIIMFVNLIAGKWAAKSGPRPVLFAGSLTAALGYFSLLETGATPNYQAIVCQLAVAGAGIALCVPAMTSAMMSSIGKEHTGIASGLLNSSRQVGGLLGVSVFGVLMDNAGDADFITALHVSLFIAASMLLVSAGITLIGIQSKRKKRVVPVPDHSEHLRESKVRS